MSHSVIIIGAGMAGISAASHLHKAGITDTVVLELRSRLGGRLVSKKATLDQSVSYDFGASWFHDALKNPLFEKAKRLKNVDYFFDDGRHCYLSKLSKNIEEYKFDNVVKEIATFAAMYFADHPDAPDVSVEDMCHMYVEAQREHLLADEAAYAPQVIRLWVELWDGISWTEASAKHQFVYGDDHLGRNAYVKNGFETVFNNELHELPVHYRQLNIHIDTHVTRVHRDHQGVTVHTNKGTFHARYMVCTVPASLLCISDRSDPCYIEWTPPLPAHITSLYTECEYGSLGKVIFEFDTCFWPRETERFYVLAHPLAKGTEAWAHPTIIINYEAMSNVPSLVLLTQSPLSKAIELMTKDQIWSMFEPVVRQIASSPVKKPFNIMRTEWNSDTLVRGSYSAGRLGYSDTRGFCESLAEGAGRVRFAGAETMAGSSNGCAHGAWYSGRREAQYIISREGQPKI